MSSSPLPATSAALAAARPGPPLWLLAEITYRCPLHCVFCYNPVDFARHEQELSTAEWMPSDSMEEEPVIAAATNLAMAIAALAASAP